MFKRLIAALILLAFCITVCVSSYIVISKLTRNIIDDLEQALTMVENGDNEKASKAIEKSEEKWDKYKTVFDVFLDHNMLEQLNVDIPSIKTLLESQSTETAKEKIEDSINALKNVTDEQKLSIGNIL